MQKYLIITIKILNIISEKVKNQTALTAQAHSLEKFLKVKIENITELSLELLFIKHQK